MLQEFLAYLGHLLGFVFTVCVFVASAVAGSWLTDRLLPKKLVGLFLGVWVALVVVGPFWIFKFWDFVGDSYWFQDPFIETCFAVSVALAALGLAAGAAVGATRKGAAPEAEKPSEKRGS